MASEKTVERYATMSDALISAAVHGMFRFSDADQAARRLEAIQGGFVTSRFNADVKADKQTEHIDSIRLWIRGFDLSEEDETLGFLGHYADITAATLADGKYTLIARRVDLPIKNHPHKRPATRSHPNWGHPILRVLKNKQRTFKTPEEALAVLMKLHEEYPDVTIPNPTKLYAMVYNRKAKPPVTKYVFEIKTHKEGGFYIDYRVNKDAKQTPKNSSNKGKQDFQSDLMKSLEVDAETETLGVHASKIRLERARKKSIQKKVSPKTSPKSES